MRTHHQVILKAVNEVLTESGRSERSDVQEGLHLKQDLDLDSLDLAVLTVKIEAETGIDVFAEGIVETVGQLLAKLER
jgi:acyl carrier protein